MNSASSPLLNLRQNVGAHLGEMQVFERNALERETSL